MIWGKLLPTLEWFAPEGWTLWCGFMLEQFLGGGDVCGEPRQDQFGKDSISWEGPHVEQGKRVTVMEHGGRSIRD